MLPLLKTELIDARMKPKIAYQRMMDFAQHRMHVRRNDLEALRYSTTTPRSAAPGEGISDERKCGEDSVACSVHIGREFWKLFREVSCLRDLELRSKSQLHLEAVQNSLIDQ